MSSNFPDANDSFSVPSSPSTTPLSSAGSGSRNHWEHHRDLGDAIVALQNNVAVRNHDHLGTGSRSTPKLTQAATHEQADTDTANSALHHTLGTTAFQAAKGDHLHDTRYMRKDSTTPETVIGVKTFDRPVIADHSNAKHNHSSATQGGPVINNRYNEYVSVNINTPPTSNNIIRHPAIFIIPASTSLSGVVYVDFSLTRPQLQEITFQVYLASSGTPTGNVLGSSIANKLPESVFRWPGINNDSPPYENIRTQLSIPFEFFAGSTAKTDQSVFVRCSVGSGSGSGSWFNSKLQAELTAWF